MSIPRIFQAHLLSPEQNIRLDARACHHLLRVLRCQSGDSIILFDGSGKEYPALLTAVGRDTAEAKTGYPVTRETESPLTLHLAQGIARGEKMDYLLQKAVELGVSTFTPLFTARCMTPPGSSWADKKTSRWRTIAIHACEQCGRNRIPAIDAPQPLPAWLANRPAAQQGFVLDPDATLSVREALASHPGLQAALLLTGPEGGLTEQEISLAKQQGFIPLSLGPRILRTETAGLAAITAFQVLAGDMG